MYIVLHHSNFTYPSLSLSGSKEERGELRRINHDTTVTLLYWPQKCFRPPIPTKPRKTESPCIPSSGLTPAFG